MKDKDKTKEQLIDELEEMRQQTTELKRTEAERKQAEQRIEHLNSVLRAIRGVNQLITRKKDRDGLLKGVCDTLIESRGYYNAWIALLDEDGKLVTTAEAGLGKVFSIMVERLKQGKLTVRGRKVLKQSEVVVTEDPQSTCADCPLSESYGGGGAFAARLEHEGKVYGLLSASVPRDFAADEEEQSLFKGVARDIAFALYSIELEEEQRKSEERFRKTIENIFKFVPEGLLIFTDKLNLFRTNKAFRDIVQKYSANLNYTEQELTEIIIEQVKNRIINEDYTEIRTPEKRDEEETNRQNNF